MRKNKGCVHPPQDAPVLPLLEDDPVFTHVTFNCWVPDLPHQELRDRDMFVVNFARGARYQNSAIVYCQKQLNQFMHDQSAKKKAQEKEKEARWREWMTELEERLRRRGEGQAGQGGGGVIA